MIELIFILGLAGLGVLLVICACDYINNFLGTMVGILGIGVVFYTIVWFIKWLLSGGLMK